ncbi:MAG: pirin family protein, partial [Chloroflexota bacterium]|nr:pirin family protein [Chloroflexota bacterium]
MPAITVEKPLSLPAVQVAEGALVAYRKVQRVVDAIQTYEGEGFPVRRPFPGLSRAVADPFVLLDQMGEVQYAPGEAKGAPDHPHRGFETVTYMIDGEFVHRDSNGGGGVI